MKAIGNEFLPLRMLKWHDVDAAAEFGEDICVFFADAVFGERDQIDLVITAKAFEQMEGAMISAAIERIRDVGINGEDFHSIESIPNSSVGVHERSERTRARDKLRLQFCERLRIKN